MDNNFYKEAATQIARGMEYMLEQKGLSATQIYNGTLLSSGEVRVNGKDYSIPQYGEFTHDVNTTVKVFVPQGNMSMAFYI